MSELVNRAIEFATRAHAGQFRKGVLNGLSLPYIVHPVEVMSTIWRWGCATEEMMAAAVLHDVLEECPRLTVADLDSFNCRTAGLVVELTHNSGIPKSEYLEQFRTEKSIEALVIKVADRICNTFDFARVPETHGYAGRYFRKADCLGEALNQREFEIRSKFGETAAGTILQQWETVRRFIGG